MNPIARFSSMNSRNAINSITDKEWIGPNGGEAPSYRFILRGPLGCEFVCASFAKNIRKVMILVRDVGKFGSFLCELRSSSLDRRVR